jgi:spermidine synthase
MTLSPERSQTPPFLGAAFFLSGFAALLYQVVWERLLALFSGADVVSAALVVGAFLAGLGLGSLGGARLSDRLSPAGAVRVYAAGNALIALYAVTSRWLFYDLLFVRLSSVAGSRVLVFAAAFLALLPPTFLMGLSLPLLGRAVVRSLPSAPRSLAVLYGLDIAGAALGSFLTCWVFLGRFGFEGTARLGAGLSLVAAILALVAAVPLSRERPTVRSLDERKPESLGGWPVLFFLSGFLAVALEVVFFRHWGVLTRSSAYTFGHVLGVFLLFDAIGTIVGGRIAERTDQPRRVFVLVQAGLVLAAAFGLWLTSWPRLAPLNQWEAGEPGFVSLLAVMGFLPLLVVAPSALLIGLGFPLVQKAVQNDLGQVGRRVALLQLANIAGNAAGSLVTGTVLLAHLGTPGTLRALAGLGILIVAAASPRSRAGRDRLASLALAIPLVIVIAGFPAGLRFWPSVLGLPPADRLVLAEDETAMTIIHETGGTATVLIQGQSQGSIPPAVVHARLGWTGPLLHPAPRDVFIIGVGSGATPLFAGLLSEVEHVRAVEIVGSALVALDRYAEGGRYPELLTLFRDPRFALVVDDARRDLAVRQTLYDVIEADATFPWSSRSGMLFSREFFELVRSRLRPRGLMVQWRATARVDATFRSVFPFGLRTGPILVGSREPIEVDEPRIRSRLAQPSLAATLRGVDVQPERLAASFAPKSLDRWDPESPRSPDPDLLNTDLLPRDEFHLNRPRRP